MLRQVLGARPLAAPVRLASCARLQPRSPCALSRATRIIGVRAASTAAAVATDDSPAETHGRKLITMEGRTLRKAFILSRMDAAFSGAKLIAVVQHNSLNVNEIASLRQTLGTKNIKVTMFPNTLARAALKGTPLEPLSPLFHSSSLVLYSSDPVLKDLSDVVKKHPKLHLMGVHVEGMVLDVERIKQFLALPSLQELHGELLAIINQPARMLASMLQRGSSDLVWSLQRYIDEKNSPPKEEGEKVSADASS